MLPFYNYQFSIYQYNLQQPFRPTQQATVKNPPLNSHVWHFFFKNDINKNWACCILFDYIICVLFTL